MKISLRDLPESERPREKLMVRGASALTTAELLGILVGSGNADETAVALMQRVMADCRGSLTALGRLSIDNLSRYKGIGPAKAVTILAACELGKRRMAEKVVQQDRFDSAQNIYDYFRTQLTEAGVEQCHILLLNHNLRFIASRPLSQGGITATIVDIRLALREALLAGATHIALCHNHPSGNPAPSRDDDNLTRRLAEAARTMDIRLIDHVIVAGGDYYSYSEAGKL